MKPDLQGVETHAAHCLMPQRLECTNLGFPITSEPTFKLRINISKYLIIIFTIWLMLTKYYGLIFMEEMSLRFQYKD